MSIGVTKVKLRVRNNIRELLKRDGRSQKWLAEQISVGLKDPVPQQMLGDWCSNRSQPSIAYIMRIQKVMGWSNEEMFEEVEE